MMKRLLLALALALAAALASPVHAQFMRGGITNAANPANCPQGTSTPLDGCSGAPTAGITKHADFFASYAPQNGQTYSGRRPSWNVAGVDYGVGYPTAQVFKDPTVDTLPTGCTKNVGAHTVTCSGANGGLTIDGWDFGNTGGAGVCYRLIISGNVNGHIIIQNSNFKNSNVAVASECNVNGGALVNMLTNAAATDVVVLDSVFDVNAQNAPYAPLNPALSISMSAGQAVTVKYSAFLHLTARGIQISTNGNQDRSFNYGEGITYTGGQALHGEFDQNSTTAGTGATATATASAGSVQNSVVVTAPGTGFLSNAITVSISGNGCTGVVASATAAAGGVSAVTVTNGGSGCVGNPTTITFGGGGLSAHSNISYNTMLEPVTAIGLQTTALVYISSGSADSAYTLYDVDHNTLIANKSNLAANFSTFGSNATAATTVTIGTRVISFVAAAPGANQVLIGANSTASLANLLTFLQASVDPQITPYTYSSPISSLIYITGNISTSSYPFASNWPSATFSSYPVSTVLEASYNTYGTINWTSNYIDCTGALSGAFLHASSPIIGAENFSGNINLATGNAISSTGTCP